MMKTAILIGNSTYKNSNDLDCCKDDVKAMRELLIATGRFDNIFDKYDLDASAMRETVREALPTNLEHDEVFFYFSGHGSHKDGEFFYCGTEFDDRRPNETGVSHGEIHTLFRGATPKTLIVVIDACYSGALLVKDDVRGPPVIKDGLRNVLQFSSSMDDQTSLAGNPLSLFTRSFLEAASHKVTGPVYYTDVANALRDVYLDNEHQTPFFVNQGNGREILADDAGKLKAFRVYLTERLRSPDGATTGSELTEFSDDASAEVVAAGPPTALELLANAEERMGSASLAREFIAELFGQVREELERRDFSNLYDVSIAEFPTYYDEASEEFMIRVLSREKRPDNMVTATIKREKRRPAGALALMASNAWLQGLQEDYRETHDFSLNCSLEKAQLQATFKPKYQALQQITLIVSCAPSIDNCYIFELTSIHPRKDWNAFDSMGAEAVRRWYKYEWDVDTTSLADKIFSGLTTAIASHVDETAKRLSGN